MPFDAVERDAHAQREEQKDEHDDRAREKLGEQAVILLGQRVETVAADGPWQERPHAVAGDAADLAQHVPAVDDRAGSEDEVAVAAHGAGDLRVAEDDVDVAVDRLVRRNVHVVEDLGLTAVASACLGRRSEGHAGEHEEHGQQNRGASVHQRERSGKRGRTTMKPTISPSTTVMSSSIAAPKIAPNDPKSPSSRAPA